MNMIFERKLTIPKEVKEMYPISPKDAETVSNRRKEISDIFLGKSDKLIAIVGPCSADNEDSVLDYVTRLAKLQEAVSDKLFMIPRVYTNKPRTTGDGYKGLLHQPDPNEKPDVFKGIIATRELHRRVLSETGFTCADEMLYPENHRYINDLLAYVAVGARSVENQQHRLTASGLDIPVGMKNPTSGDISVMLNAIHAANQKHTFIYRGWEVHTEGNPLAHAILRGYVDKYGTAYPNYHYEDLTHLLDEFNAHELNNPSVIVDANHANSGKNPFEQERIINEVLANCKYNRDIKRFVKGFMIESYIVDGRQDVGGKTYGQSITDACLGWEKTEKLLLNIADKI